MTLNEKFKNIRERLFLNLKQMSTLIGIKEEYLKAIELSEKSLSLEQVNQISNILNIEPSQLLNSFPLDKLSIKKELDMKKYSNTFKAYSEILKTYFPKPCCIFVLTKIKQKNRLNSFLDLFFNNDKESIINEMNTFTPSYLIENNNSYLLVNINDKYLYISEVELDENKLTFLYDGYKYKKQNEINLK